MDRFTQIKAYASSHYDETLKLLTELAQIPAPSHEEDARVAYITSWLEGFGCKTYRVDGAKNVVIPIGDTGDNPLVVFTAHTDVVFPDRTPLPMTFENGTICCPGVGDNTASVAVLLMAARYLFENRLAPQACGLLLVADSCEEGLGNLKGARKIVETYGERIRNFIAFDGGVGKVLERPVGSCRFRVTIETEGGHSYGSFGNRNAVEYMAALIEELYHVKVPELGTSTFNVGTIQGGTSVNTIAQSCEMTYDIRSDYQSSLDRLVAHFHAAIECFRLKGVEIRAESIGVRPCMGEVDETAQRALQTRVVDAVKRVYGIDSRLNTGSTDCNIPLSLGIPSTRTGTVLCKGAHTRTETMQADSLIPGVHLALDLMLSYFD